MVVVLAGEREREREAETCGADAANRK